ncbi:MAG: hypothetical protein J5671_01840 [Bacteroidaceae bacterium]|nr:hypothetical protein [Bacteroidaceae bacterium]
MATLKIIADKGCKLFIDQEFICDLNANKLIKHEIEPGIYLVDVIANEELQGFNQESFDLEIGGPNQDSYMEMLASMLSANTPAELYQKLENIR